ncbi:hypothetical protein TthHB5018_19710 [Thermus thermophilus]|uniref:Uncharacterized protein n=1 Tax=Thermus thermophilus TaxID=274 RepID=A0A7R7TF73_THETH|nr:hypothetical protein TthHB5018_19710 [Thermus thermophilus]
MWEGTWTSTQLPNTSGTFCIKITQNGNQISGPLYRDGVYFGDASGTLNGNQITFGAATSGNYEIRFTGTVSGDSASGNYTLNQGTTPVDAGTWAGNKTAKTDCPTSGAGQNEFSNNLNQHSQELYQAFQQLSNDPAFQALLQIGMLPMSHPTSGNELPRGGYDYTDPNNPEEYPPAPPYDLGFKWMANNQLAELLVDWDNGKATVWAHDQQGQSLEVPQASQAEMTLDDTQVANADFSATWYSCAGTYIQEPTNLAFTGWIGQTAKLNWNFSYALTEGSTDTITSELSLSTTGTNPTASVSYQLTLSGNLARGADCFTEGFDFQSGSFTFTSSAGSDSFTFHINVTGIQLGQDGRPTRVDLNGYVEENSQRALTFSGYLDQDDLNGQDTCPGENVLLFFRDGALTLEQWLQVNGHCQ